MSSLSSALAGRTETIRVLHVDDEPDFAELAATYLKREDDRFAVETATSATEGLDCLSNHQFDCIVSDYDMPDQNGIEFLETIREDHPDLPFILYTGKGSEEVASDAISADVTDYLQKERGTGNYTVLANRVRNAVEHYRAEQARHRQHKAIESAREGISILNEDGEFIYVNQVYADLYGYDPEEILGEHWELIYPDSEVTFTREEILPTVAEEGYWHGETTGLRGDGTTFPEDHVVSRTDYGELVCTVRDLSDRRERETELRMKTRAMGEAPIGIMITGPEEDDNPLVYVNDRFEELTGYDSEDVLGRNCRLLQGDDTADEPVAAMRAAIEAEEPVTVELRNYRKDGTEFWNRVSIAPVRDEDGTVRNYVGFQEDITETRRRRERHERQRETLLELTTDDAVTSGDFETAARRITETAADVLDVPRVNIWLVDDDGDDEIFTCVDHFERATDEHAHGMELDPEAYPAYFEALATHQTIAADDVHQDTRTAELTDDYLDAHDIGALLDGTLRVEGEIVGVICHEQTGGPREWTEEEIEFASDIADIVHRALRNQERNNRERELERTNALLSTLIETLPAAVLVEDESRNVLSVNERLFELFEMPGSPDDVVGADCGRMAEEVSDVFVESEGFVQRINHLVEERKSVRNEELSLRDGRTFARSYAPIELPVGDGHLWMYRDITKRKERERQLREEQQFVQSVFQSLPDPLYAFDTDGYLIRWNEQLEAVTGYSSTELEDMHVTEFVPEDETDTIDTNFRTILEDGRTVTVESAFVTKDGTRIPYEFTGSPLDAADGAIRGATGVGRDITERKRHAEQLRALNERSQMLMAADTREQVAEIGIAAANEILGLDASSIQLYDAEQSGLVPVAATDTLFDLVGDPPVFTNGDSIAWRAYEQGEALAFNDVRDDPDIYNPETPMRSELYFPLGDHGILLTGSPVLAAFDEQTFTLGKILAANIESALDQVRRTERLRAREAELTRQNDRLDEFASIVSHDLRNPLNVAEGRLELVSEECDSDHLEHIERALDRMNTLIEDLLALAREGEAVTDLEPIGLAAMVESCWANVETADATLVTDIDHTIYADESRLKQVFENLVRNAVEHGGDDVTVTVGGLDDGFYIKDDGPGIPEVERDEVFNAGYSTRDEGTGFGLSIVKQVVEAHDWKINVTEGSAGGARFEITGVTFTAE